MKQFIFHLLLIFQLYILTEALPENQDELQQRWVNNERLRLQKLLHKGPVGEMQPNPQAAVLRDKTTSTGTTTMRITTVSTRIWFEGGKTPPSDLSQAIKVQCLDYAECRDKLWPEDNTTEPSNNKNSTSTENSTDTT